MGAPKKLKEAPKPKQQQFSITSFLPMLPPPVPSASTSSKTVSPVKKDVKGKGKAKEVIVIDDDDDDEELESTPSVDSLWVDRFAPQTRDDLSVHPKKILDVSNWFAEAFSASKLAKYRRLLVLSGPSGAGKTAVLRLLAAEQGIEILEWKNGANWDFAGHGDGMARESVVRQFADFLTRAGMVPALDLGAPSSSSFRKSEGKRLVLLEDLPNTSHYPTKMALRSAVQQYLASPRVTCPLVVIISEALVRPGVGHEAEMMMNEMRGESLDARSVLGPEILYAPGCREIQFNAIAVTIMKKALLKTLDKAYPSTSSLAHQALRPSIASLQLLIAHSNGDIRSALMSLEFLAAQVKTGGRTGVIGFGAGGAGSGGGKKRKLDGAGSGEEVKKLLQHVTARESSLFIFHALGKVLYSKRWDISPDDDKKDAKRTGLLPRRELDKLPRHLRDAWGRKPSKVDPDALFAEAPVDSDVFLSYVQHNYPQFTDTIEECLGIAEGISMADSMMRLEGDEWLRRAPLTAQYSFALSVRSTLLHLPSPVTARKQVLRKSQVWDKLKLARDNDDRARDLLRREGRGREGGDWMAFLGRVGQGNGTSSALFWKQMATFPPVAGGAGTRQSGLAGEALGERDLEEEDGEMGAELEEEEEHEVEPVEEEEEVKEEVWWDESDDIADF